jgi:hypothetical protein
MTRAASASRQAGDHRNVARPTEAHHGEVAQKIRNGLSRRIA